MNSLGNTNSPRLLGRFLVKFQDATQTGLTAEQVIEILEEKPTETLEIFRIHRIVPNGRMELVGVAPAAFDQRDCLLFSRHRVKAAREDFDTIIQLSKGSPPPCRIQIQFSHVKQFDPTHVVVLIFPAPCSEAVGQWLAATGFHPGDHADGSPAVLTSYENADPQIVKQHIVTVA